MTQQKISVALFDRPCPMLHIDFWHPVGKIFAVSNGICHIFVVQILQTQEFLHRALHIAGIIRKSHAFRGHS